MTIRGKTLVLFVIPFVIFIQLINASIAFYEIYTHFNGTSDLAKSSFAKQFSLKIDFQLLHKGMSSDNSSSENSYFIFQDTKENGAYIIIGYLDVLNNFSCDKVIIKQANYKKHLFESSLEPIKKLLKFKFSYPFFFYNHRFKPKDGILSIYGIKTDSTYILRHKNCREYRYTGSFNRISFVVNNDRHQLLKNMPLSIQFYNQKYGSLSIFENSNGEKAFILIFCDRFQKNNYYKCINQISDSIEHFDFIGFPHKKRGS